MRAILLLTLSVIVLSQSFGAAYAVHVTGHFEDPYGLEVEDTISIEIDSESYEAGDTIIVYGEVSDYNEEDPYSNFDVTLRVIASNNNIISIQQLPLANDGSYLTSILTGGPLWKFDGDYTISVSHGSDKNASVTFAFVHSTPEVVEEAEVTEVSEEELAQGCGEGTHLEDGVCVLDESVETTPVSTGTSTGTSPSTGFNSWIYSISFTILIAFAIMIVLYLISRASRNKE